MCLLGRAATGDMAVGLADPATAHITNSVCSFLQLGTTFAHGLKVAYDAANHGFLAGKIIFAQLVGEEAFFFPSYSRSNCSFGNAATAFFSRVTLEAALLISAITCL